MGNTWRATTSWSEVCRCASGRRKHHSLRRLKAELRRIDMARRLNELRDEAWRKFHQGETERIPRWIPFGARTLLAREFGVSRDTIWRDMQAIEAWDMTAEQAPAKDSRFAGAYAPRPRMPRINVRVPTELLARLKDVAQAQGVEMSDVTRQALQAFLSGPPDEPSPMSQTPRADDVDGQTHQLEDCAHTLLQGCLPEVRERITATAHHFRVPLSEVISRLLLMLSKHPGAERAHSDV
jgi:predicted DNA binding CopG/RHH family protein